MGLLDYHGVMTTKQLPMPERLRAFADCFRGTNLHVLLNEAADHLEAVNKELEQFQLQHCKLVVEKIETQTQGET